VAIEVAIEEEEEDMPEVVKIEVEEVAIEEEEAAVAQRSCTYGSFRGGMRGNQPFKSSTCK
jgi:hypothetical protein